MLSCIFYVAGQAVKTFISPSEMGQKWPEYQFGPPVPKYFCNRPTVLPPLAVPVALATPIFGRFLNVMAAPIALLGDLQRESACAVQLCQTMPNSFAMEVDRQDAFLRALEQFLDDRVAGFSIAAGSTSRSVGGIQAWFHNMLIMLLLVEMKNELALGGGDPTFRAMRFTELQLEVPALAALRGSDVCPALLLEVLGPQFRLSALTWMPSGHVLCEPLTPLLHMLPLTGQPRQLDDLVRALCAMRRALEELREHYTHAVAQLAAAPSAVGDAVVPDVFTALPYPLQDGHVFADVEHFGPGKLLYEATLVATGERVCIKFAPRSYAAAVHAAWAAAGLAPALLEHRMLPGGIHMIIMELCSPDDGWCMLSDTNVRASQADVPSERAAALAAADAALRRAHAVQLPCGRSAVHGDCRSANVLVRRVPTTPGSSRVADDAAFQVRFLDFDWAGPAGETLYPLYMSTVVMWPPGATPGSPMTQAHDRELLTSSARKL